MIYSVIFLVQTEPVDVIARGWHVLGASLKDVVSVLGVIAVLTAILVVWAFYYRKRRRHHSHSHHHHHSSESSTPAVSREGDQPSRSRRRRRRRRHRPRNPTLAETGGLPPIRPDRPTEPLP